MENINFLKKLNKINPRWAKSVCDSNVSKEIRKPQKEGGLGLDESEEFAIIRKEINRIYDCIKQINPNFIPSIEFETHNNNVENIKHKINNILNE